MATKLHASYQAVYAALETPRNAIRTVIVLLVIHTGLLAYSAYVHSPTLNEPGHLVAGLSYWKFGRFDVYNVNPPLVKMVAALPVMAVGYNADWSGFNATPGARPEMGMGEDFVAANGERSFLLFTIARWACVPFSWLGAIVCYLWARDLYGRPSGVFAAAIWCFEPNVLAHASLITADAAGSALGLAAAYTFWRWLQLPTWSQAALTGVVLGLAELSKTTLILLYPLWPLMWLIYRWPDRNTMSAGDWLREATMLALTMLVGLYVLNLGYGFEGSLQPLKEFHFVSDLFVGATTSSNSQTEVSNRQSTNRFAECALGEIPVLFPKNYLLGIDIQQNDFEHYGRASYLDGEWRDHGWWYYYIYACTIKVPLGLWGLMALSLCVRLYPSLSVASFSSKTAANVRRPTVCQRDECILLLPAIVIFAAISSKFGFSEHMRYIFPSLPYFFIAVSQVCQFFGTTILSLTNECLTTRRDIAYKIFPLVDVTASTRGPGRSLVAEVSAIIVAACLTWLLASSLWIYPHSLSYFNETIGGPANGSHYLLSSNVDWGQELLYLKSWARNHPASRPLHVHFLGQFRLSDIGMEFCAESPELERLPGVNPIDGRFVAPGWYVIGVSLLHGYAPPAQKARELSALRISDAATFIHLQPVGQLGYSMYIYRIGGLIEASKKD